jgi:hypothetical protein
VVEVASSQVEEHGLLDLLLLAQAGENRARISDAQLDGDLGAMMPVEDRAGLIGDDRLQDAERRDRPSQRGAFLIGQWREELGRRSSVQLADAAQVAALHGLRVEARRLRFR